MPSQPPPAPSFRLAIIGDGYAAGMLCLHLARQGYALSEACVIGSNTHKPLGHGAAYGCQHPDFRLNVRDDLMVIDADAPHEFTAWARHHIKDDNAMDKTSGERFYRRQDFAAFITASLSNAGVHKNLTHIKGQAVGLKKDNGGWQIALAQNPSITAKCVVIASGNPPPMTDTLIPSNLPATTRQQIITHAWDGTWLARIQTNHHVLLVGGGLTALDACLALHKQNHRGRITLVTPRLPLPPRQVAWQEAPHPPPPWPYPLTASRFLHHFRACLPLAQSHADTETPAWQEAFENVRTILPDAWTQLPQAHRIKLQNRLGWLWHRLRYRAAPQTLDAVDALTATKQLQLVTGRVTAIQAPPKNSPPVAVMLADGESIACDWIVIASGPGHDPLTQSLIDTSVVATDLHQRWILVNSHGVVLSPHAPNQNTKNNKNNIVPNLWLLGPPSQFSLGDVVGASTIARHAKQLATLLIRQH